MLTVEQVRATLSEETNAKYTDEEIIRIRDEMRSLADIILEEYCKRNISQK